MSDLEEWMNPLVPADTRVQIADGEIERLRAELAASREREARMRVLLQAADVLFAHHCRDCTAWNWLDNTRAALAEGTQG